MDSLTRTSDIQKHSRLHWSLDGVKHLRVKRGSWPEMNACCAVVHSSLGKSSSGLLFLFTNPLICRCRGSSKGREQKENVLWPVDELSLSTLFLPSSFSSFLFLPPLVLPFLRVPGMPPIFFCSNYCFSKLCQRAEIVLMRGPAAFASVI